MELVTKVSLFRSPYTICYISKDHVVMPDEKYKSIGVNTSQCSDIEDIGDVKVTNKRNLKYTTTAFFLQPFVKECLNSVVYRSKVLAYLSKLNGDPGSGIIFLKLILEPPDRELIDYAWNERMNRLVWTRIEIENAFSWLSTLGGAYSALGDYFAHCADEAGRISIRQYKLSKILGDDSLAARSCLYSALSESQKGNLKLSRQIVRRVVAFGISTQDKRLICMCHGVWAKLKYLKTLKKDSDMRNGVISHTLD